ncbi:MAG: hypothetical protein Q9225_003403 [Loekoesia sp. 1 TL-2023]
MASSTPQASQPMRIDVPEPRYQSIIATEHGDSDLEDTQGEATTTDEDMQSVIGVSISRKQTRLKLPTTPAAEKAAALGQHGGDAFFDLHQPAEQAQTNQAETWPYDKHTRVGSASEDQDRQPYESLVGTNLPTPWTSGPKFFEKHPVQNQAQGTHKSRQRAATGTMGSLADLNIKRFMSNFTMPSLPKPSSIRDVPMPATSLLVGGKVDTRTSATDRRHRRANSDMSQKSQPWPQRLDSLAFNNPPLKGDGSPTLQPTKESPLPIRFTKFDDPLLNGENDGHRVPQPSLKRATSDQSLTLRRATSTASSLGDDSRWEHVQKQVNSRAKAIADSLQDTSIRLPGLPSLSNVNLGILRGRPEFSRHRAVSDNARYSKRPETRGSDLVTRNNASLERQRHIKQEAAQAEEAVGNNSKSVRKPQKSLYPNLDQALGSLTGDVVILGGYRGSILRSAKPPHRQLWVPVKVGLNIRKVNLEVGLQPEDEETMEENIIPSGMLLHLGPVDMGRRLLKRLRSCRNAQEAKLRVHDYGYDWRLSPHLLSRRLIQYLERLPTNSDGLPDRERGVTVIAHSLGGLIARHAVNQRPELFAGVIYAGVPKHCVNILGPLRNGDEVLLSSKVLTAQVNFTLRTSFLLLPEDGRCFIDKQTKQEYPVNFFDVEEWKCYAFSPCIAPTSPAFTAPERKGLLSFVTDNIPSLPLFERIPMVDRREATSNRTARKTQPKSFDTPAIADIDPNLDSQSYSSSSPDAPRSTIPLRQAEEYLKRTLADIVRFKAELKFIPQYDQWNIYPPLSVLYSTSVPTVSRARVASRDAIKCKDAYDDLAFASGDGVCLARAAMLPEGYKCVTGGKVRTERGHVGLLGDLEAVGKCLLSVLEGRKGGVGLGPIHNTCTTKGRRGNVDS